MVTQFLYKTNQIDPIIAALKEASKRIKIKLIDVKNEYTDLGFEVAHDFSNPIFKSGILSDFLIIDDDNVLFLSSPLTQLPHVSGIDFSGATFMVDDLLPFFNLGWSVYRHEETSVDGIWENAFIVRHNLKYPHIVPGFGKFSIAQTSSPTSIPPVRDSFQGPVSKTISKAKTQVNFTSFVFRQDYNGQYYSEIQNALIKASLKATVNILIGQNQYTQKSVMWLSTLASLPNINVKLAPEGAVVKSLVIADRTVLFSSYSFAYRIFQNAFGVVLCIQDNEELINSLSTEFSTAWDAGIDAYDFIVDYYAKKDA